MTTEDRLSSIFAALADSTRSDIVYRLRNDAMTVSEIATHYPISRPAISRYSNAPDSSSGIAVLNGANAL